MLSRLTEDQPVLSLSKGGSKEQNMAKDMVIVADSSKRIHSKQNIGSGEERKSLSRPIVQV